MKSLFRKLGRMLRLAALASLVIGVVKAVLGRRKAEVIGEASWPTLAEESAATSGSTVPKNGSKPKAAAAPQAVVAATPAPDGDWIDPVDGACPTSHPIKANAQSKIFHVPGGASYDRTIAERCYTSAQAAEADGFRAAKR